MFAAKRVLIAVPSLDARPNVGLINWIEHLESTPGPYQFGHAFFPCVKGHDLVRNRIAAFVLRQPEIDAVLMVDDDMDPASSAARLFEVDADLVGGRAYILHAGQGGAAPAVRIAAFHKNPGKSGFCPVVYGRGPEVQDVDALGGASLLIKRHVLADPRMLTARSCVDLEGVEHDLATDDGTPDWAPPIFKYHRFPNGEQMRAEDLDFSYRAKQLGYRVVVHLGAVFDHLKTARVGDFIAYAGWTLKFAGTRPPS